MPTQVVHGARVRCSQGSAPGTLTVAGDHRYAIGGQPAATVADMRPGVNIASFGMCRSPANPAVQAAAAAGMTPPQSPCVPALAAPWSPGCPKTRIGELSALTDAGRCACLLGGSVAVDDPGTEKPAMP